MKYYTIALLIFVIGCKSNISNEKQELRAVEKSSPIDDFNNLKDKIKQELDLNKLVLLGKLSTQENEWYILEGATEDNTYQDIGVYLYPLKKGSIPDTIIKSRYSYPGKEFTFNNDLIFESRVFFGECTEKYNNSIIWYQREQIGEKWDTSYYVLQFNDNTLNTMSLNKEEIDINTILRNVQRNVCKEIPGKEYYDEP